MKPSMEVPADDNASAYSLTYGEIDKVINTFASSQPPLADGAQVAVVLDIRLQAKLFLDSLLQLRIIPPQSLGPDGGAVQSAQSCRRNANANPRNLYFMAPGIPDDLGDQLVQHFQIRWSIACLDRPRLGPVDNRPAQVGKSASHAFTGEVKANERDMFGI
jgi:hypothetical protein